MMKMGPLTIVLAITGMAILLVAPFSCKGKKGEPIPTMEGIAKMDIQKQPFGNPVSYTHLTLPTNREV